MKGISNSQSVNEEYDVHHHCVHTYAVIINDAYAIDSVYVAVNTLTLEKHGM